jgi:hypothetical protein
MFRPTISAVMREIDRTKEETFLYNIIQIWINYIYIK